MSQVDDVLLHIFVSTESRVSNMLVGKGEFTSQHKANVNQGERVDNQTMRNENDQNNLRCARWYRIHISMLLANLTTKEEQTRKPTIESHDGPRVPRSKPSTRRVVEITFASKDWNAHYSIAGGFGGDLTLCSGNRGQQWIVSDGKD